MFAGMIPARDFPGEMIPGQFGPMIRVRLPLAQACAQNHAESCTGMPSVITTASPMPASMASTAASLANFGGTKSTETSVPVSFMASSTPPKTGTFVPVISTVVPALRALTPPTILVPEASIFVACFMPSEPVSPWTMTLLFSSRKIDISGSRRRQLGGLRGRVVHGVHHRDQGVVRLGEDPATLVDVVAVESDDERLGGLVAEDLQGLDDPVGDGVARGDAPEDVDEDALDVVVAEDDVQPGRHHLGRRAAPDVEEVGGLHAAVRLAGVGDDVEGAHDQPGAVADDADLT